MTLHPAGVPSRRKPIESWCAALPNLPCTPNAVLASAPALSELNLLREPLSVAAHTAGEDVRELEPSDGRVIVARSAVETRERTCSPFLRGQSQPGVITIKRQKGGGANFTLDVASAFLHVSVVEASTVDSPQKMALQVDCEWW